MGNERRINGALKITPGDGNHLEQLTDVLTEVPWLFY